MANSPPPISMFAYEPPESLWLLVETYVHESERDEIKNLLGESLIEQSIELHEEINMLLEIWKDYREETDNNVPNTMLPEPPAARERLIQEIRFFVDNIREKAKENGKDPDRVLSRHNSQVLDYVMENKRPGSSTSRPSTAHSSRNGRETPLRQQTPLSDRMSLGSTASSSLSEEVESMNDKLNIIKLDEVSMHLRQTLEQEVQQLLVDIAFLQECLEDEAEYRSSSRMSHEPSLVDLREERGILEKTMLTPDTAMPDVPTRNRDLSARPNLLKKMPSPPKGNTVSAPKSSAIRAGSRPSPMKASHQIMMTKANSQDGTEEVLDNRPATKSNTAVRSQAGSRRLTNGNANANHVVPDSPTHVTIRTQSTQKSSSDLTRAQSPYARSAGDSVVHLPCPPSSAKPTPPSSAKTVRPSTADRFRKMVKQAST